MQVISSYASTASFALTLSIVLGGSQTHGEIPAKVLAGWKSLKADLDNVNGTVAKTRGSSSKTSSFAIQGLLAKSESEQEVVLVLEASTFRLVKTPSGKWSLAGVQNRNEDPQVPAFFALHLPSIAFMTYPLLEAANSKIHDFKDWQEEDGLCRCVVTYVGTESEKPYLSAELEFDVEHHYRLSRQLLHRAGNITVDSQLHYGESNMPTSISTNITRGNGSTVKDEKIFADVSTQPLADDVFRLPHYGLPDYAPPSRLSGYRTTILVMGILVVVAVGLWYTTKSK